MSASRLPLHLPSDLEHVVWDWNGTLLDDAWLCLEVINGLLAIRGLPTMSATRYSDLFRFPVRDYYADLGFDFAVDSFEQVGTEFIEGYQASQHRCQLRAHAEDALAAVLHAGMTQSVLSASQEWRLEEQARRLGIRVQFSAVLGLNHHFATSKLERGAEWMRRTNLIPHRVLLVGDTDHDAQVAHHLGMHCALVSSGHQAEHRLRACGVPVLGSLEDLTRALSETDEERRRLSMSNRDIEQATEALERLSQDPKAQELARWREDQLRLCRMELTTVERRGREEGLREGHQEGLREGQERTVHQLCKAFGIEIGAERAKTLASMPLAELSALIDYLAQRRQWPEH